MLLGEVAPLAEPVLVPMLAFCGFVAAAGIVYTAHAFAAATVGFVGGVLSEVPVVGKWLGNPVLSLYKTIVAPLASAEAYLDSHIAIMWHRLARVVTGIAEEIAGLAILAGYLVYYVAKEAYGAKVWAQQEAARLVRIGVHAALVYIGGREVALARYVLGRVGAVERTVVAQVRALDAAVTHVVEYDIASLRARADTIARFYTRLYQRVARLEGLTTTAALTAAVALALSTLGLDWLRCRNVNRLGRAACALPFQLIEDLLGLSLAFVSVVDPVALAEAALALETTIEPVVEELAA